MFLLPKPPQPLRPFAGPYAPNKLAWLMNEAGSRTLRDATTNRVTAALRSATEWAHGPFGPCLSFSGTAQAGASFSVRVPNTFWWAAWIKPRVPVVTWCPLFTEGTSKGIYVHADTSSTVTFLIYENAASLQAVVLPVDQWRHVAVSSRAGNTDVYVDGVRTPAPTVAWTGMTADTLGSNGGGGEMYIGLVDSILFSAGEWLTPIQARTLAADHWRAFRPRPYPYILVGAPPPAQYTKDAAASIVFTPTAAAASLHAYAKAGSASLILTPTAAEVAEFARPASALLILTPTAAVSDVISVVEGSASALLILTPTATVADVIGAVEGSASARIIFRARARVRVPDAVVGDHYLGRFQVGRELPLAALVRDARGRPTPPTTRSPTATLYDLETGARVESVEVPKARGSRVPSRHAGPHPLGRAYAPGRYAILYRASTGGFTGMELATFEVDPGGDAAGPVLATYALSHPSGLEVLAHLGSGVLLTGRSPRLPR